MKKRWITVVSAFLLLGTMSVIKPMSGITVEANSAQTYWQGVSASGALIVDENCPIEVQHEKLVFDIDGFPSVYGSKEDFVGYTGKVTASYTFYNPADYTVKATLAFPFGNLPYYADIYDPETGEYDYAVDTEKYNITVNGEAVEKDIRFTLSSYYDSYDILKSLEALGEGYVNDDFYSLYTSVTKYSYEVSGIDKEQRSAYASFLHTSDPSKTRIWLEQNSGMDRRGAQISLGEWVENGKELVLYVFGEPLSYTPDWTVYENAMETTAIDGAVELVSTQTMTFEDFAFSEYFGEYSAQSGISAVDWYNGVVCSMNESLLEEYGCIRYWRMDAQSQFMRWYQYDIELAPKSTLINEVTAPIYPSIDGDYEPAIYGYTYLLSPTKTWNKFGTLEIEINTPYYLIDDEYGFTKTDTGYSLSLEGLPEEDLEFTLSESENPKETRNFVKGCAYALLFAWMLPVSCIGAAAEGVGCSSMLVGGCGLFAPVLVSAVVLFVKKRK